MGICLPVQDSVEPGSVIHTDGWPGYLPLENEGYGHDVTILRGNKKSPSEIMPRVHLVISLLKRWLLGTHQGAVSHKHLDYYLDEFTFRFNRRRSKNRGKVFYRLVQQAVVVEPVPLDSGDGGSAVERMTLPRKLGTGVAGRSECEELAPSVYPRVTQPLRSRMPCATRGAPASPCLARYGRHEGPHKTGRDK